jgi:hypothetical protein
MTNGSELITPKNRRCRVRFCNWPGPRFEYAGALPKVHDHPRSV